MKNLAKKSTDRLGLAIVASATIGIFLMAEPIILAVFQHGEFSLTSAEYTSFSLRAYILGLLGFGYNPAAALIVDGELIGFVEEERMINFKGAHFMFPGFAAKWCLEKAKLTLDDIDYIAWGWNNPLYRFKIPFFFTKPDPLAAET